MEEETREAKIEEDGRIDGRKESKGRLKEREIGSQRVWRNG